MASRRRASWKSVAIQSPGPYSPSPHAGFLSSLPVLTDDDPFVEVVRTLCASIEDVIIIPYTFEQLKTGDGAQVLLPLVDCLIEECSHPFLVSALLVLRYHFKDPDDRGVNQARAHACELLAWRVTLSLSRQERLEALLSELPFVERRESIHDSDDGDGDGDGDGDDDDAERATERTNLLRRVTRHRIFVDDVSFLKQFTRNRMRRLKYKSNSLSDADDDDDPTIPFLGLNALEIAAVADAKKFLSQNAMQRAINAIWKGDIMFWDSVSTHAQRRAIYYDKYRVDPYCRLRVPVYQKTFETGFLVAFLVLYFVVMQQETTHSLTAAELLMYVWIAAFTYEEVGSFFDSGMRFYITDLWNLMDIGIVGVAIAFVVTRAIGLTRSDPEVVDLAFSILSLMAIPLVPRTFSLLSLHPYFGILIPSLSQMTKDLLKFLVIVVVVYFGFASTFILLGRDAFTPKRMLWLLIYAFNGSGYLLLENSERISRTFGPALVVIFVSITNVLLLPTLISLLTNSLTMVMGNAREEFLFQYSILVLESCASKRLTYFLPPLNLIPLIFLRPLRLALPASQVRAARIVLLKVTHAPFVALILAFERLASRWQRDPERWRATSTNANTHAGADVGTGSSGSKTISAPTPVLAGSKALGMPRRHSRSRSEGLVKVDRTGLGDSTSRRDHHQPQQQQHQEQATAPQRSAMANTVAQEAGTTTTTASSGIMEQDDLRRMVARLALQVEQLQERLGGQSL